MRNAHSFTDGQCLSAVHCKVFQSTESKQGIDEKLKCVERRRARQHQRNCMCTDYKQADTVVLCIHAANGSGKLLRRYQREKQRVL